jgi:hypothetical protein
MPRNSHVKVFRTSIGSHDAYVAAPSRKAALAAWSASTDLFGIGAAEIVTDPALTAEPLAHPGTVIKRSRGSTAAQMAAAPAQSRVRTPSSRRRASPLAASPRPTRRALDEAEAALAAFEREAEQEIVELKKRGDELPRARKALAAEPPDAFAAIIVPPEAFSDLRVPFPAVPDSRRARDRTPSQMNPFLFIAATIEQMVAYIRYGLDKHDARVLLLALVCLLLALPFAIVTDILLLPARIPTDR